MVLIPTHLKGTSLFARFIHWLNGCAWEFDGFNCVCCGKWMYGKARDAHARWYLEINRREFRLLTPLFLVDAALNGYDITRDERWTGIAVEWKRRPQRKYGELIFLKHWEKRAMVRYARPAA